MKADPEVKMISAEAPILFAKGCDIFITELTMRAWIHAEENKRRTLQRSDIASALSKSDMFDFLIDIVPREEAHPHKRSGQGAAVQSSATVPPGGMPQGGVHPHQMPPPEYPMGPPIQQDDFRQSGMYAPPIQGDPNAYAQAQPQMFVPGGYEPYGMAQQPVSSQLCRFILVLILCSKCTLLGSGDLILLEQVIQIKAIGLMIQKGMLMRRARGKSLGRSWFRNEG